MKTYVPAIITNKNRIIKHLKNIHKQDERRIEKVVALDIHQANELDKLEYGFIYGGSK